jgi:hypothetical protein
MRLRYLRRGAAVTALGFIAGSTFIQVGGADPAAQGSPEVLEEVPSEHGRLGVVEAPAGELPTGRLADRVVDSAGNLRGYTVAAEHWEDDPLVNLPGGFNARPVYREGKISGYFVLGNIGFIEPDKATNGELLTRLDSCYQTYAEKLELPGNCEALLTEQGVDVQPAKEGIAGS